MSFQKKQSDNSKQSGILCSVKSCGNSRRKHSHLRFFRIPSSDSIIGRIWRARCKISSKNNDKRYLYICEQHFPTNHILKKTLRKGAVPTLNLDTQLNDHSSSSSDNTDTNDYETDSEEDEESLNSLIDPSVSGQDLYFGPSSSSEETKNPPASIDIIDIGPVKIENEESEWFDSEESRHSLEPTDEFQLQDPLFAENPGTEETLTQSACGYSQDQESVELNSDKAFLESLLPYVKSLDMQQKLMLRMDIQQIVYNHTYPLCK